MTRPEGEFKIGDRVMVATGLPSRPYYMGNVVEVPATPNIDYVYGIIIPETGFAGYLHRANLTKILEWPPVRRISDIRVRALMRKFFPAITCKTDVIRLPSQMRDNRIALPEPREVQIDQLLSFKGEPQLMMGNITIVKIEEYAWEGNRFNLRVYAGYDLEWDRLVVTYAVQMDAVIRTFPQREPQERRGNHA